MKQLKGTGVALATPFNSKNEVDVVALKKLVDEQINNDIDYLVVLGTTGESVTLSNEEKKLVMQTIVEQNDGQITASVSDLSDTNLW